MCEVAQGLGRVDQNCAEIIHIGQGRAGDDLGADLVEKAVAVMASQRNSGGQPLFGGLGQRVGRDDGARDFRRTIDAIGVTGDEVNARCLLQMHGRR